MEVGLIECNQVRTGRSHRRVEHMGVIWIPNIRWPPKVNLVDFRMLQEGCNHDACFFRLDAQRVGFTNQHRLVFQDERHRYMWRERALEHLIQQAPRLATTTPEGRIQHVRVDDDGCGMRVARWFIYEPLRKLLQLET